MTMRTLWSAVVAKYDASQPRAPKGSAHGGQWTRATGASSVNRHFRDADTDDPDHAYRFNGVAAPGRGGSMVTTMVTDRPERVVQSIRENQRRGIDFHATHGNVGDDLHAGIYGSDRPDFWQNRRQRRGLAFDTLSAADQHLVMDAAEQYVRRTAGTGYLTASEAARALGDIALVRSGRAPFSLLRGLDNQPYNVPVMDRDWLRARGVVMQDHGPTQVKIRVRGRFVDATDAGSMTAREAEQLIALGYDGALTRAGFSTNPQLVVWRHRAVRAAWVDREDGVFKYDASQPREPKGSPGGGRFARRGGTSASPASASPASAAPAPGAHAPRSASTRGRVVPSARRAAVSALHEEQTRTWLLRHEEAVAYAADGRRLLQKQGEDSFVEFSESETRALRNARVFLHNHPTGTSFSTEGISFSAYIGAERMRVVGTYFGTRVQYDLDSGALLRELQARRPGLSPEHAADALGRVHGAFRERLTLVYTARYRDRLALLGHLRPEWTPEQRAERASWVTHAEHSHHAMVEMAKAFGVRYTRRVGNGPPRGFHPKRPLGEGLHDRDISDVTKSQTPHRVAALPSGLQPDGSYIMRDEWPSYAVDSPSAASPSVVTPSAVTPSAAPTVLKALPDGDGLYVGRPLVNVDDLHAWARRHGVPEGLLVPDPHVTVVYSREFVVLPLDRPVVRVPARAFRGIGPLGPDAVVLFFESPALRARFAEARAAGATSDYDRYRPHLTLAYAREGAPPFDWSTVPPPDFDLIFGPEAAGRTGSDVFESLFAPSTDTVQKSAAGSRSPFPGLRYLLEQRTPHTIAALRGGLPMGVTKADAEQRLVSGWALVSNTADGRPVLDRQGEVVPLPVMARALKGFMAGPRILGGLHLRDDDGRPLSFGTVVEALVVTPVIKRVLELPPDTPLGGAVTAHVTSDLAWEKVKDGTLRMFSIGGLAAKRRGVVRGAVRE